MSGGSIKLKFNPPHSYPSDVKLSLDVPTGDTIEKIKKKYIAQLGGDLNIEGLHFSYRGSVLGNDQTPEQIGLNDGSNINVYYRSIVRRADIDLDKMSRVILAGVYDDDCPFSLLQGCPHILKKIWDILVSNWKSVIKFPAKLNDDDFEWSTYGTDVSDYTIRGFYPDAFFLTPIYEDHEYWGENDSWGTRNEKLMFPAPSDININMMPFILERNFDACKLPEYVRPYWSMIETCIRPEFDKADHHMWSGGHRTDVGKVCYLTIQETTVVKGTSQRRAGLHTDSPGSVRIKNGTMESLRKGDGQSYPFTGHHWGSGGAHVVHVEGSSDKLNWVVMTGGIYIATSVPDSAMAWDCKVVPGEGGREEIGELGNIEHLRAVLPPGQMLAAHQLYWITDRTPHESLPLPEGGFRQFFRLVTSDVSLWYREHSTPSELGVVPDPTITKIVKGSKFSPEGVELE